LDGHVSPGRLALGVAVLGVLCLRAWSATDAAFCARTTNPERPRYLLERWFIALPLFIAATLAIEPALKTVLIWRTQAFNIPTGGMLLTLIPGDHLLVNNWRMGYRASPASWSRPEET